MVERPLAGVLLTDFLESASRGDRLAVRRLVASGKVRVNGEVCLRAQRLRTGDVVQVPADVPMAGRQRSARGDGAATALPVLFESASALVIDKPPGTPTVPDRAGDGGVHGLLDELRPGADLRIVHRLDRDTSGCLVLGKGLAAARHFDEQFREGLVDKTYVAVVDGVPVADRFAIDAWLGPDRRRPGKVVAADAPARGFRDAHTAVVVRVRFAAHALVELRPATGRGHQLRVHLASIGHPITGDRDYGGEPLLLSRLKADYKIRRGTTERPLLDRSFLHASKVAFTDVGGARVEVTAPLPRDLDTALHKLESFDEGRR